MQSTSWKLPTVNYKNWMTTIQHLLLLSYSMHSSTSSRTLQTDTSHLLAFQLLSDRESNMSLMTPPQKQLVGSDETRERERQAIYRRYVVMIEEHLASSEVSG